MSRRIETSSMKGKRLNLDSAACLFRERLKQGFGAQFA
jgi:hypothetical protein